MVTPGEQMLQTLTEKLEGLQKKLEESQNKYEEQVEFISKNAAASKKQYEDHLAEMKQKMGFLNQQNLLQIKSLGGKGKKFHEDKILKNFTQPVFDKERKAFPKWAKGIRIQLDAHGFNHATSTLLWAAAEKSVIKMNHYDDKMKELKYTDEDMSEHLAFNKALIRYLELYTEGEAGGLVESVTEGAELSEQMNGAEAWRLVCKRFAPKTAAQAMKIQ